MGAGKRRPPWQVSLRHEARRLRILSILGRLLSKLACLLADFVKDLLLTLVLHLRAHVVPALSGGSGRARLVDQDLRSPFRLAGGSTWPDGRARPRRSSRTL